MHAHLLLNFLALTANEESFEPRPYRRFYRSKDITNIKHTDHTEDFIGKKITSLSLSSCARVCYSARPFDHILSVGKICDTDCHMSRPI